MKEKMSIVMWLVDHGYQLFGESPEHFCERFDLHVLEYFKECFKKRILGE